ncbi:MAG: sugar ABC transporter permease [Clostridia bacterium]|nr:sugar ABC transporter permease [Clostridia bacterium]
MLYRDKRPLLVFLLPALVLMLILLYYPFVENIINSFFEIRSLVSPREEYIGLENYEKFFMKDDMSVLSLKNSLVLMVLTVIFQVGLALVLALLVNSIQRGVQFFRVVYFFPIVISATAIGLMFSLFYAYDGGMLNQIVTALGGEKILWLSDENAFTMVSIPVLWQYVGFYFVIILTGLAGVPEDVYESAAMDGATGLKKTWYITLPLISDVLVTCTTLAITGAIKVFDLPSVIAKNGAPKGLTHFLGTYMYQKTFIAQDVDYGSAISIIIVLLGVILSRTVGRLLSREERG